MQITEQLSRQTYSEHYQTFKMKRFAKRITPECRCTPRNFPGQWGMFVELGHFDKYLIKNTNKEGPQGIFSRLLDTLKTTF